jgi:hypothetical protein
MEECVMTATILSTIAGAILSLLFSYVPGLAGWYDRVRAGRGDSDGGTAKRLVMLALLVLVSAGSWGLACSGWGVDLGLELACDRSGLVELVQAFIFAIMANQSVYKISPKPGK